MSDLVHTISVLSVRIAGVVSARMLLTGGSCGNYTLLGIEVLPLIMSLPANQTNNNFNGAHK
ncbi:hypothetical protein [Enterobacter kobei]|uniref:hypothetical protein n=1 Tax=Enterobacter kobei TaxID=208224 RepID=UPI001E2E5C7C|nr:hypothetical protein [Enterobacter kobei]MCD0236502.1 hypothetical protein [Enterobacter kobei]MCK7100739.1 hypothetical protein [Enterobacter kobei]